jgi:hypothetical protein
VVEILIAKLENFKSPGSDQISAEMIQAGGETSVSAIHKLINSICNQEEFPYQWKKSVLLPITKKVIEPTVIIIMGYHCYELHTKVDHTSISQF